MSADEGPMRRHRANRCIGLLEQYERTQTIAGLDEAVAAATEVLSLTPLNHPNLYGYLGQLSIALIRRFDRTSTTEDT